MGLRGTRSAAPRRSRSAPYDALRRDLTRIGDRRADLLIAAALRVGHEYYVEAQDGNTDEDVEGEAHAVAGNDRRPLAEGAKKEIAVALGHGPKVRRREAAYMAAVRIAAIRER